MLVQCHDLSPSHILYCELISLTCSLWCIIKKLQVFWKGSYSMDLDRSLLSYVNSWPVSFCRDVITTADLDNDDALPQATNNNPSEEQQPQETSTAMVHTHTHTQLSLQKTKKHTGQEVAHLPGGCTSSPTWFRPCHTTWCHTAVVWESSA